MEVAPPAPANCPRYERGGCPTETVAAPPRSATPLTESSPLGDAPSRCHCDIHLWMAFRWPQKLQERAVLPPPDDVARSHTLSFLPTLEATLQTLRLRVRGRSEVRAVRKTRSSAIRGCLHCHLGGLSFQRHLFNVSHMRLRSGHVLPELEIRLNS